jgi:hypothetical protein
LEFCLSLAWLFAKPGREVLFVGVGELLEELHIALVAAVEEVGGRDDLPEVEAVLLRGAGSTWQ